MTSNADTQKSNTAKSNLGYTGDTGINVFSGKDNGVYKYILSEL
jgi:hypothetical protein